MLALGVRGGLYAGDSSCYLVGIDGRFPLQLDGGSFTEGVDRALALGTLKGTLPDLVAGLRAILVTHIHLDHLHGWALRSVIDLGQRLRGEAPAPLVLSNPDTVRSLQRHVFNGELWFDAATAASGKPVYLYQSLGDGETLPLEQLASGLLLHHLRMEHPVPTSAFLIELDGQVLAYFGDTGPLPPTFWKERFLPRVEKARRVSVVIEVSFSNEKEALATSSGHLTPTLLASQLAHLPESLRSRLDLFLTHLKPGEEVGIHAQLEPLRSMVRSLTVPVQGARYALGR